MSAPAPAPTAKDFRILRREIKNFRKLLTSDPPPAMFQIREGFRALSDIALIDNESQKEALDASVFILDDMEFVAGGLVVAKRTDENYWDKRKYLKEYFSLLQQRLGIVALHAQRRPKKPVDGDAQPDA